MKTANRIGEFDDWAMISSSRICVARDLIRQLHTDMRRDLSVRWKLLRRTDA